MKITNYFVDQDGRTYRVALTPTGRPLIVIRVDRRFDTGPALDLDGRIGKKLVAMARQQHGGTARG